MIAGGYKLLSDDVVAITFDQAGQPKVMPAFNQVKLLDDAARKFGLDLEAAEQIHPQIEKRRHQAQRPARSRLLLRTRLLRLSLRFLMHRGLGAMHMQLNW